MSDKATRVERQAAKMQVEASKRSEANRMLSGLSFELTRFNYARGGDHISDAELNFWDEVEKASKLANDVTEMMAVLDFNRSRYSGGYW